MELKLELALRYSRNARAQARKARVSGLSIKASRRGCNPRCPRCMGDRTFSRNLPKFEAIAESLTAVAASFEPLSHTFEMVGIPAIIGVGDCDMDGVLFARADLTTVATVAHYTDDNAPVVSCYDLFRWDDDGHDYSLFFPED